MVESLHSLHEALEKLDLPEGGSTGVSEDSCPKQAPAGWDLGLESLALFLPPGLGLGLNFQSSS